MSHCFIIFFLYFRLWLCWLAVKASRGHSLVAGHRLLIVEASPVAEQGSRPCGPQR